MALICEQFHQRPDAYSRWLYGDELPPDITRLDWHAFNVAAAAFLAEAHKQAQDKAMREAKNARSQSNARPRDSRGRFRSSDREERATVADNPFAPGSSLLIPDSAFSDGPVFMTPP